MTIVHDLKSGAVIPVGDGKGVVFALAEELKKLTKSTLKIVTMNMALEMRILQTENLSAAGNFERKGAISYVKDRQRGKKRGNFPKIKTIYNWYRI